MWERDENIWLPTLEIMITLNELSTHLRNRQSSKITFIAVAVTILLLAILLKLADFDRLINSITTINVAFVLLSFLIFLLMIIIVSLRLLFLLHLSLKKKFIPSLDINIIHTVLLCILPARLGDVCYPFLLNKNLNIIISHSFVNLLVLRLYDFMVSAILFLFSTITLSINTADKLILQKTALFLFIITICIFGAIKYFSLVHFIPKKYRSKSVRMKKIISVLCQLQEGFHAINIVDHIILFIMTCIKWIFSIGVIYFIFRGLNMDILAAETILVTTGMNLVVALPIQAVGGFGITEAAMALLLGLIGYATDEAVTYSLVTRFIWLAMPLSLGIMWLLFRNTVLINSTDQTKNAV